MIFKVKKNNNLSNYVVLSVILYHAYVLKSNLYEPVRDKTNNLGCDQVRHKQGCTVTEAG